MNKENIPQLNERQRERLDQDIMAEELDVALRKMKLNKSPGSDGLTVEFYRAFWEDLSKLLLSSLNYSFNEGSLSKEQRRGIICLLPKKAGDRHKISNWRPISLLNVDYKILTKLLASRMQLFLTDIIYSYQTGFLKGRYIGTNIRLAEDIIQYADEEGQEGWLLALDFQKAFDTVSWKGLIESLKLFGFGEKFIQLVKITYNRVESCVMNNGFTTAWFPINRGVRQGCCLSPYLFLTIIELLAIMIREAKDIKVFALGGQQGRNVRISLFADDMVCCCGDREDSYRILDYLERFRRYSGLTINKHKSKLLELGPSMGAGRERLPFDVVDSLNLLGIQIGRVQDENVRYKWNFEENLNRCQNICNSWENRNLSLKGKVVVINSLIISSILYLASITSTPKNVFRDFKKMVCKFLWNSTVNRVGYNTIW